MLALQYHNANIHVNIHGKIFYFCIQGNKQALPMSIYIYFNSKRGPARAWREAMEDGLFAEGRPPTYVFFVGCCYKLSL
jgi:YHS domain-containing protein